MTIPSIRNDTGCLAALWRTAIFLKNAPSCSAVNAMRSSAESCGGIGFFGHSTFVQPQAVVTSIRTSGCFEVLVARRETWRVVPSRTSPSDSIECSNLSASSVSTSGLSSLRSVRRAGGGFPAARRRRSGGLRRSRPREFCVSCESVRDWLFGDIEPVVGEHIVERLSEQ